MISRRHFLAGTAGAVAAGCARFGSSIREASAGYPFTLGVASGDPDHQSVVLWTRLAPDPYDDRTLAKPSEVAWSIAHDRQMAKRVQSGVVWALPDHAHCVHVEVGGLDPDREYFYRFECGGFRSRLGRTRTLPGPGTRLDRFTIASTSCQNYSDGYFTAYRDIVERDPHLIVHTGDYIYESARGSVRSDPIAEAISLSGYRTLYAHYKSDEDLQRAHAMLPWLMIWDDHEVVNDWGPHHRFPSRPTRELSFEEYLVRKEGAIKAYFEHMPFRLSSKLKADTARIYDRLTIGDLMELNLLDTRLYRDRPACKLNARKHFTPCDDSRDPARTLLGREQEKWLLQGFGTTGARWNTLVQTTLMAPCDLAPGPERRFEADGWESYPANRQRILDMINERQVSNAVSLGGNIHAFYAGSVHADPENTDSKPLVTEFISTSVSAAGGGDERYKDINGRAVENPSMRYFENRKRGYLWCDVDRENWRTEFRAVHDVTMPESRASTIHEISIESARPS
jgi:alkaline phosphatase D